MNGKVDFKTKLGEAIDWYNEDFYLANPIDEKTKRLFISCVEESNIEDFDDFFFFEWRGIEPLLKDFTNNQLYWTFRLYSTMSLDFYNGGGYWDYNA